MTQNTDIDFKAILEGVRKFCQKELAPHAEDLNEESRLAPGLFRKFGELGILGLLVPVEYGGQGLGGVALSSVCEELGYADASSAMTYLSHAVLYVKSLATMGTSEQRRRFLPPAILGEAIGCAAMTEPSAGSDILSMKCAAHEDDKYYDLTGIKSYVTNGSLADQILCFARTGDEKYDIAAFVLPRQIEGLTIGPKLRKMGLRGMSLCEMILEHVKISESYRLSESHSCVKQMFSVLEYERLGIAAIALGIMRGALDKSLKYATKRKQFGQNIMNFQAISHKISEIYINYRASRAMVYEAAQILDSGRQGNQETAAAKIMATQSATKACLSAIQVLGAAGCLLENDVERMLCDAKTLEIAGGTTEILHNVIMKEFARKYQVVKEKTNS